MEVLKSHGYALLLLGKEHSLRVERAQNADLVFVLSKQGKPLMPCRPQKARKLLMSGRAKVVSKCPFVIRLQFGSTGYVQRITAGMDSGSKRIGCAATSKGQVVYQSEIILREDISSKMEQRRMYRRNRRGRKTRYRPARFDNRGKIGKLAPSLISKLNSHLREKDFIETILPISQWNVELASFDIHKISNPSVSKTHGWTYQQGNQKGFYNLKAYILNRDGYTCAQCSKSKTTLHVHHIKFRSEGGTDEPENLITLCKSCHDKLHQGQLGNATPNKLKKKTTSKTKHATQMGILKSQLKKSDWDFQETFGYETKFKREQVLGFPKTHYFDAVAICAREGEVIQPSHTVYFKRHVAKGDRQLTSGARSQQKIPVRKLFGLRKFDLIQTPKGIGFVKGKRSTGYFALSKLDGSKITDSVNVKKNTQRIQARTTTLIEKGRTRFPLGLKSEVSAA